MPVPKMSFVRRLDCIQIVYDDIGDMIISKIDYLISTEIKNNIDRSTIKIGLDKVAGSEPMEQV